VHPNEEKVTAAARAHGLEIEVRSFPEGTRTAADAAAAIGCEVAQIVKSLVFVLDGDPVVALVAGSNRLDEQRLADALGGRTVARADAAAVRVATGFAIGGVPPFGHATTLATAVDEDLLRHDVVWAAAGTPHAVFAISPGDLVRVTRGRPGALAAP
jgi:Cys-tRNA(Pro) deacylase